MSEKIKASDIFKAMGARAGASVNEPLYSARRVSKGDILVHGREDHAQTLAGLDGYAFNVTSGGKRKNCFLSVDEFKRGYTEVPLPVDFARRLPEEAEITPVRSGETVTAVHPESGKMTQFRVDEPGFVLRLPRQDPIYLYNLDFNLAYKCHGQDAGTPPRMFRKTEHRGSEYDFIVLQKDMTIRMSENRVEEGKAGQVLFCFDPHRHYSGGASARHLPDEPVYGIEDADKFVQKHRITRAFDPTDFERALNAKFVARIRRHRHDPLKRGPR